MIELFPDHELDQAADARLGTIFAGRYRLESVAGQGGVSTVYRATHLFTGRTVALKLLLPQRASDPQLVDRFLREARAASTLGHAHVVDMLDMGVDENQVVYLVMELVEGETLFDKLKDGPLSAARASELLLPVMDALGQAHALGIVHRDIKPDNIVIGDRGDGVERAILIDFGIAKVATATWLRATQAGYVLGTPYYMSPEQCQGGDLVGPRADVWSMGVLAFECLSGHLPFNAPSITGVMAAIATGKRLPLRTLVPDVPSAWADAVERALSLDPLDRFPDLAEMAAAIRASSSGLPRRRLVSSLETTATGETIGELPTEAPPAPARFAPWPLRAAATLVVAGCVAALMAFATSSRATPSASASVSATHLRARAAASPRIDPPPVVEPTLSHPDIASPAEPATSLATPTATTPVAPPPAPRARRSRPAASHEPVPEAPPVSHHAPRPRTMVSMESEW